MNSVVVIISLINPFEHVMNFKISSNEFSMTLWALRGWLETSISKIAYTLIVDINLAASICINTTVKTTPYLYHKNSWYVVVLIKITPGILLLCFCAGSSWFNVNFVFYHLQTLSTYGSIISLTFCFWPLLREEELIWLKKSLKSLWEHHMLNMPLQKCQRQTKVMRWIMLGLESYCMVVILKVWLLMMYSHFVIIFLVWESWIYNFCNLDSGFHWICLICFATTIWNKCCILFLFNCF